VAIPDEKSFRTIFSLDFWTNFHPDTT
jgi:hypothetical protein